jgi:hypothetical protein
VENDEILWTVKGEKKFLHTKRKGKWIGHILRRNCILKHVIEGKRDRSDRTTRKKK